MSFGGAWFFNDDMNMAIEVSLEASFALRAAMFCFGLRQKESMH